MTDELTKLRKLLEEKNWPKWARDGDYLIFEGRFWRFVSDDPLEENIEEIKLSDGRFQ